MAFSQDSQARREVRNALKVRYPYFIARRNFEDAQAIKANEKTLARLEATMNSREIELQEFADNSRDILDGAYEFWSMTHQK